MCRQRRSVEMTYVRQHHGCPRLLEQIINPSDAMGDALRHQFTGERVVQVLLVSGDGLLEVDVPDRGPAGCVRPVRRWERATDACRPRRSLACDGLS